MHLILNGFMGTGKTTVGRIVAHRLGKPFVDLDEEITSATGLSIVNFFAGHGEKRFRELESETLKNALTQPCCVIALGGGALLDAVSRELVEREGTVITLTCSSKEIVRRIARDATRPLLDASRPDRDSMGYVADRIGALLHARRAIYDRYSKVDTTGREPETVAEEVIAMYERRLVTCHAGLIGDLECSVSRSTRLYAGDFKAAVTPGSGALDADSLFPDTSAAVLITDPVVRTLHGNRIREALDCLRWHIVDITVSTGEPAKTLQEAERVYRHCYDAGIDRNALVIGLGGGAIGDLAGFVAATYLRGLHLMLIPTTLLAQVDAAIGGKTGLDLAHGKNMIGAFYPADVVILDPSFLYTLPVERLTEGLAEMVKIAVVRDSGLLDALERLPDATAILGRDDLVRRAAVDKLDVVRRDPYDRGERALLNFGHTGGHALEALSEFSLPHGRAVAIGMVVAAEVAVHLGLCGSDLCDRLVGLLERLNLPVAAPEYQPDAVLAAMSRDKKRAGGKHRLVLPLAPGSAVVRTVPDHVILGALQRVLSDSVSPRL